MRTLEMRGPALRGTRAAMYDAIAGSALAREQLREVVHEPSVESALFKLRECLSEAPESCVVKFEQLAQNSLLEPVLYTQNQFRDWFYAQRAKHVVEMREPWSWFSQARYMRRRILFHAGPTNSGKTHSAVERLLQARSGVYCAPIKALASQMWTRINRQVPCDLLIGDERRYGGFADHVSCTMEMAPVDQQVDVAVIDEVQMFEDKSRGWAFTRALLGLPARELHICGEWRAVELVEKILKASKEHRNFSVINHKRFTPLEIDKPLNGDFSKLSSGDCLVVFSRNNVFEFKAQIERERPDLVVNIVYGGLPFRVREEQTAEFNDGVEKNRAHVLVATDAIAYGLNLNIRRMIFTTVRKFNGYAHSILEPSNILQVAGRAGRYGLKFSEKGYVTTLHEKDWPILQKTLNRPRLAPIQHAGLIPTADTLLVFSELYPKITSFHQLLSEFNKQATTSDLFFMCDIEKSLLSLAALLEDVDLTLRDRIVFCFVPMNSKEARSRDLLKQYAISHSKGEIVEIGIETPDLESPSPEKMADLETDSRMLEIYSWLALRFTNTFKHYDEARLLKDKIGESIQACLKHIRKGVSPVQKKNQSRLPKTDGNA